MKSNTISFHSFLAADIRRFIAHKRAIGRRYDVEEKTLRLLDHYLVKRRIDCLGQVTPDRIEEFLASRPRHRPRSYNHLLCTVRRFFAWMVDYGELDRSPVCMKPRHQTSQRRPFIFDVPAARRLLSVARTLPDNPRAPMRGRTYHAIFSILYGLGLRVGEACRLRVGDVDLDQRLLVIRKTKFYKSRLTPFGPRMAALLHEYLDIKRAVIGPLLPEPPLFSFTDRGEVCPSTVTQTFHALMLRLAWEVPPGCSFPRLHDLRHSFAVGTLLRWYRSGVDPGAGLLKLATFLGHVDAASTAVYLHITTALLGEANRRFEAYVKPLTTEDTPQ